MALNKELVKEFRQRKDKSFKIVFFDKIVLAKVIGFSRDWNCLIAELDEGGWTTNGLRDTDLILGHNIEKGLWYVDLSDLTIPA